MILERWDKREGREAAASLSPCCLVAGRNVLRTVPGEHSVTIPAVTHPPCGTHQLLCDRVYIVLKENSAFIIAMFLNKMKIM